MAARPTGRADINQTVSQDPSRRDVLKGGLDALINRGKTPFKPEDSDLIRELEYYLAKADIEEDPSLWNESWGPLDEAYPEDVVSAIQSVRHTPDSISVEDLIKEAMARGLLG